MEIMNISKFARYVILPFFIILPFRVGESKISDVARIILRVNNNFLIQRIWSG